MAEIKPIEAVSVFSSVSALGLLAVAAGVPWPLVAAFALAAGLVWLGYQLAAAKLSQDRARVDAQRRALNVEWRTLEDIGRVRAVFINARWAMQEEAMRAMRSQPPRRTWPRLDLDDFDNN